MRPFPYEPHEWQASIVVLLALGVGVLLASVAERARQRRRMRARMRGFLSRELDRQLRRKPAPGWEPYEP